MKYLLIEHGDGTDEAVLTICDTPETRERLTRAAISDEPSDADSDIEQLRENGIVHFEGDPSLEWLNVCAIRGEGWEIRSDSEPRHSATDQAEP